MRRIILLKSGNRLVVDTVHPRIRDLLAPYLTFTEQKWYHGYEAKVARSEGRPPFESIDWECFGQDHRGRLATSWGFYKRITDVLRKRGIQVLIRDLLPPKDPSIFEPQWDQLKTFGINLKHGQDDFLVEVFSHRGGRIDCPPGFGKTFMIGVMAILLPRARIDVISKRVPVVCQRIYPELCGMLLDVGVVGGGLKKTGHRIMCYTAGSMQHAAGDADFLFGDECHELVSDQTARKFGRWGQSVNYGLSASHDMRLDNKDLRAEGIFGPIIYTMKYEEAKDHGMVVPIQVIWHSLDTGVDICEGEVDVRKKQIGIWTNSYRNDSIARVANKYGEDEQVLICVETIEHAVHLKSRLPNFALVYAADGLAERDRRYYVNHGLLDHKEPRMTEERKTRLTKDFETGRLKKAICTTVWNVGVNFRHLAALIRADGGGSPINDTQIPGRVSRTHKDKSVGVVHDFLDEFNQGLHQKAMGRLRSYKAHRWTQVYPKNYKPPKSKDLEGQKTFWEETDG